MLDAAGRFCHKECVIVCGREISAECLESLRAEGADGSRRQRARRLCEQLNWIGPSGRLQLTVGRQLLARLEQAGLIPASLGDPVSAAGARAPSEGLGPKAKLIEVESIECDLEELGPVELVLVSSRYCEHYRIWKQLLERYHYLGAGPLCGAQLRYLIKSERGWIGAMAFSAAARRVDSRDRWIRWSEVARRENLHRVVNQSRFLIPQTVKIPYLASHVLGLAAGRIQKDWRERHGYEPFLLESFVERERFQGTCYRAANWQVVGLSAGRGRQDRQHQAPAARKLVLVYPLDKKFREKLCAEPEQRRLFHRPAPLSPTAPPPQDWAEEELAASPLPSQRLRRRALVLARDFFARPQAHLPQACGSRAKTKAAYRFFDHCQVSMQTILKGHYEASMRRARQYPVVLAVQDTTDLNYSAHPLTQQLGPIADGKHGQVGLLVHDTMLYNLEGTPLGLLDVQCWVRGEEEMGQDRRNLPIEQKESYKWLHSLRAASALQAQCPRSQIVSMGDREADLYELFVAARDDPHQTKFLVRLCQDRRLAGPETELFLWGAVLGQEAVASMKLKVPRKKKQPARTAEVEVRYRAVELPAPSRKPELGPVKVWAVSVQEKQAPEGAEPVEWMLLTNLPVESPEAALEKIQWYCLRFPIEVYHRTLKSGCKIEERQLGSAERIESCLGIDLLVTWRIVHLTKLGRETPQVPCTVFFEPAQWQAVFFFSMRQVPPKEPPALRTIILMVAQLGGFLGRKSDGQPGAKSMWLGLQRMDDLAQMWRAIKSMKPASLLALLDSS